MAAASSVQRIVTLAARRAQIEKSVSVAEPMQPFLDAALGRGWNRHRRLRSSDPFVVAFIGGDPDRIDVIAEPFSEKNTHRFMASETGSRLMLLKVGAW